MVDTKQPSGPAKRRQWSVGLKRRIVTETLEPGSSMSIVARRQDVNTNQLFKWRRELLPKVVVDSGAMVPAGSRLRTAGLGGRIVEAGCWAHVRRKFFDVRAATRTSVRRIKLVVSVRSEPS